MERRPLWPGWLAGVPLALVLAATLLIVLGCSSDSKVNHLVQRARAQVAEMEPHPDFVPTPLAGGVPPLIISGASSTSEGQRSGGAEEQPQGGASRRSGGVEAQRSGPDALALETPAISDPRSTDSPVPAGVPAGPATVAKPPSSSDEAAPVPVNGAGATVEPAATALPPATAFAVATRSSTSSPEPTLTPSPTSTPAYQPAAPNVALAGLVHYWQAWNNCGPATLATDLSYFGSKLSQTDIAATLRPDADDKNVNPDEMVAYVRRQGFQAIGRVNGDQDRLRLLLSNGIPVLVETWMEPKPNDGMGHYRLLTGYDDASQQWIAYDSYDSHGVDPKKAYSGIRLGYEELDGLWRVFNRTYVVVYTDEQAAVVAGILGNDLEDNAMWLQAESTARAELQAKQDDAFSWFNLGSDLIGLGRDGEAAAAYDQARRLGLPWRMLWYQFGPFEAYYKTARYQEVVALADATLKTTGNIEELWYWRGLAKQGLGDVEGARQSWQRAEQLNRNYRAPVEALAQLK